MSEYIDRKVAREYLHIACESIGGNGGLMLKLKFDAEPPADVVPKEKYDRLLENATILRDAVQEYEKRFEAEQPEIIMCKDCKWYGRVDKRRFFRGMDCLQKRIDTIVPDKDFCSRAERRNQWMN